MIGDQLTFETWQIEYSIVENTRSCGSPECHLSAQEPGETVLHLAVRMGDRNSLHIVDFLAQNR